MRIPLTAMTLTLVFAACAQPANQSQQSGSPSPAAPAAPTASPSGVSTVGQQVSPSPVVSASPGALPAATPPPATAAPGASLAPGAPVVAVPTATPAQVVVLPPNAPPQIVDLHVDKTVVQSGDTVSGTVRTSSNVASVEARIANFSITVPKIGEGRFALSYTVPDLPFFLRKTYNMVVIARNTAGAKTERVVPITIH